MCLCVRGVCLCVREGWSSAAASCARLGGRQARALVRRRQPVRYHGTVLLGGAARKVGSAQRTRRRARLGNLDDFEPPSLSIASLAIPAHCAALLAWLLLCWAEVLPCSGVFCCLSPPLIAQSL